MMVLFEGGPWDGQVHDVPRELPSRELPRQYMVVEPESFELDWTTDPVPAGETLSMRTVVYSRTRTSDGRWVYAL